MKKLILLLFYSILFSSSIWAQKKKIYSVNKTNAEWKNELTTIQYFVLRESGTEPSFSSPLNSIKTLGVFVCAACKTPLYKSKNKYDSGSGWPSFDRSIKGVIEYGVDYEIGVARTELKCATCGGHLGHMFNDGPKETTGLRHCINGAALLFIPQKKDE